MQNITETTEPNPADIEDFKAAWGEWRNYSEGWEAQFDRGLAAHDRAVKAEAWEECTDEFCKQGTVQVPANPYAETAEQGPDPADVYAPIVTAARTGTTGTLDPFTYTYRARGGTYIIASQGTITDSGRPRDLIAILPGSLDLGTRVLPLYVAVDPDLVDALRSALD